MTNSPGMSLAQLASGNFGGLPGGAGIGGGLVSRNMFAGMSPQQAQQTQQQLQSSINNGSQMWGPGAAAQMSKLGQIASGFQGGDRHQMGPIAQMASMYGGVGTSSFQQALQRNPQLAAQYDILTKPGNSQYAQVAAQYGGATGRFAPSPPPPPDNSWQAPVQQYMGLHPGANLSPNVAGSSYGDFNNWMNQNHPALAGAVPVGQAAANAGFGQGTQPGGVMGQSGFNPNPFGTGTSQGIMGNLANPNYRFGGGQ